jgi:hypothetical protein
LLLAGLAAVSPCGAQDLAAFKGKWVKTDNPGKGSWIEIDGRKPARVVLSWGAPAVMTDAGGQYGANVVWRTEASSCWYEAHRTRTKLIVRLAKADPPGACLESSEFEEIAPPRPPEAKAAPPPRKAEPAAPPPSTARPEKNEPPRPSRGSPIQSMRTWNHNGSVVRLESGGQFGGAERRFYYESPREGLLSEGVTPGTLLFGGIQVEDTIRGTAFVFKRACGRWAYNVSGRVSDDNRIVTMVGQAPRVNASCQVIGYRQDTLVFEYIGR